MRRDMVYLRRNWIDSILSIALPVFLLSILVMVKNTLDTDDLAAETIPEVIPTDNFAYRPLSFRDYVTTLQVDRNCTRGNERWEITGIPWSPFLRYNWQVPLVKCDSTQCEFEGQDAQPFCEYFGIAVAGNNAGGASRAQEFAAWLYNKYPLLNQTEDLPFDFEFIRVMESSQDIDNLVKAKDYGKGDNNKIAMGIVFDGNDPDSFRYSLRQNSTNFNSPEEEGRPATLTTPDTAKLFDSFAKDDRSVCVPLDGSAEQGPFQYSCTGQYFYNGVLTFQRLVNDYILEASGAADLGYRVAENGVSYVQFPAPSYLDSGYFGDIADTMPLLVVLGFLYPIASMIGYITKEKELRQKELMKMMSVTESDIGWSWFLTFTSLHMITAVFMTLISSALFENSDVIYLLIFWIATVLNFVLFSMTMGSISSKSTRAILIGILVFFSGVFIALSLDYQDQDTGLTSLLSLLPVAAMSFGLQEVGRLEDLGIGLKSNTVGTTDSVSGWTFNNSVSALLTNLVLWGFLTWYLNRVIPPDYGQAEPLWFPIKRLIGCFRTRDADEATILDNDVIPEGIPFEPVPPNLSSQVDKNILIRDLRKEFGDKTAVDNLNLTMYNGQITALLGHNGAGKTTTIGMISGALKATSGSALVAGKDIRTQMPAIRKELGICLQHDCLFPRLTVREHLQFFSRLKGLYTKKSKQEAEDQIDQEIKDVALFEKRNTFSSNLSGGMKRKLSLAIAFCGDSKVVLLDEPTSGMDPFSRRFTWNVIRSYREDRCIVLTTHFMDEADILGDRIAIMAEGQLRCYGGSLFLKKTYGVGYQLVIEKIGGNSQHGKYVAERLHAHDETLQKIVEGNVSEAKLLSNVGAELSYQLPLGAASKFGPMFDDLDKEIEEKRISSYGVGITTLDEVFLLVARGDTQNKKQFASSTHIGAVSEKNITDNGERSARSKMDLDRSNLFFTHLTALLTKRAANFRRDKKAWCCTTIFPSIFVTIGLLIFKFGAPQRDLDPLLLTLDDYNPTISTSPRNPVAVNTNGPFVCQPGQCAYQTELLDGDYFICGDEIALPVGTECSISTGQSVLSTLAGQDGFALSPVDVDNITASSQSLFDSMNDQASSHYGAVFFTHEPASVLDDGTSYSESVIALCTETVGDFATSKDCQAYDGYGYVVQYNFTALHVSPLFQTLADEALAREALRNTNFKIECTLAPLPPTRVEEAYGEAEDVFSAWFLIVLSFPFIAGTFATFIVTERENKGKHLQTVAGVKPFAYWFSSFIWDTINYQFPLWITIILFFAFDVGAITTTERGVIGGVITVLALFGPAAAGFAYCCTFAFKSPSLVFLFLVITGFIIGMGGPLTIFILFIIGKDTDNPKPNLVNVANALKWCLRPFPPFCLGQGIYGAINIEAYEFFNEKELTVWDSDVLLVEVIFLAVESVLYLGLATLMDIASTNPRFMQRFKAITSCFGLGRKKEDVDITVALPDDSDVLAEQDRVLSGGANDDLIVVSEMTKVYDNGKKAVNNFSLGIPPGECFGLLGKFYGAPLYFFLFCSSLLAGINGAGKTSLMGMLTAEFAPTSGDASLAGYSVVSQPEMTRRLVGYCPQFDAHFANMTGREHVELYAAIKGIPREFVKEAAADKLREVGLSEEDSDRLSAGYSGGMKRRLSLACAMIGQPRIVFLDECSTGVDPVARREIWQLVSDMVAGGDGDEGTSVILTTHSMDECEALCRRIGIMANGRLRCLGSAQHLKSKFGQGFQIEMRVKGVQTSDTDYTIVTSKLLQLKGALRSMDVESLQQAGGVVFNLEEVKAALTSLTRDSYLADLVREDNPNGYTIFKNASSGTCTLEELAGFCSIELRMRRIEAFVQNRFPGAILRERQDTKSRYEVSSESIGISKIFSSIEQTKEELNLADYGVSQTSLEQVFNMHAAEAEKLKAGRNDG